jgi:pimeloyl-ACP methyl ester carboxylesterase
LVATGKSVFFFGDREKSVLDIPGSVRLLILPGFGNESSDYFLDEVPQGSLVRSLKKRGWKDDQINVLPMKRSDWLQVFLNGAFDLQFWLANAPPTRPAFSWYLNRIATSIQELTSEPDTDVVIIGHSAGGWLARAALGFGAVSFSSSSPVNSQDTANMSNSPIGIPPIGIPLERVLGMVTLGAPHLPPPPERMDMTRGALRITNEKFPGAFHLDGGVFYITVIGNAVHGFKQERTLPFEQPNKLSAFAYRSYDAVCGKGETVGDGIVPSCAGHLDGALQLDLDGIFHSIGNPDSWYGSDSVLDSWHSEMIRKINDRLQDRRSQIR